MSDLTWMFIAFAVVWIGIGGYVMSLGVRQRNLERRLTEATGEGRDSSAEEIPSDQQPRSGSR